ncbi:hypothetical protein [Planctomicrobium sp. SH527]|uniref:hypothetical protein n=1 Tax=Planctomicrobium sp. SH527 TaxID=3448123 RepID=UPI003F5BCB7E
MKFNRSFNPWILAFAAAASVNNAGVMAGCPCGRGGNAGIGSGIPMSPSSFVLSRSGFQPEMMQPYGYQPSFGQPTIAPNYPMAPIPEGTLSTDVPPTGVPGVGPGYSGATATSWQPPPGTLGRTYQLKSRPIPVEMHPRSAIIDVRIKNATNVRVHDMNVNRTQDYLTGFQDHENANMWHFTSEPLIPGLTHICRVEARFDGPEGEVVQERYVRLIMGRVIELEF